MNNNTDRITAVKSELQQIESRRQILLADLRELTSQDTGAEISATFLEEKAFVKEPETPEKGKQSGLF